jgi:hypothetical protein
VGIDIQLGAVVTDLDANGLTVKFRRHRPYLL